MGQLPPSIVSSIPNDGERIAIIGAGPTGTYLLQALLPGVGISEIVLFESSSIAGPGLPYAAHLNDPHALSNIAGMEIPPLVETVNSWACRQPRASLEAWGIADTAADETAFFPRIVLGHWLADQFNRLVGLFRCPIDVRLQSEVVDVVATAGGCRVDWSAENASAGSEWFDRVIVATGYGTTGSHTDAAEQRTGKSFAGAVRRRPDAQIGLLGSSLSAIDAVMAIALAGGSFVDEEPLKYVPQAQWRVTMMSRNGLLPEADFWFPMPLPTSSLFNTKTAMSAAQKRDGDLDQLFRLFADYLNAEDPSYGQQIGLATATPDDFADRYFEARKACDPWVYARTNLEDAYAWKASHSTPSWRIALLAAHEVFSKIVPSLSEGDLARFQAGLKRVFTDNYAAVPHLSVQRLLALNAAGMLNVIAIGEDYDIKPEGAHHWIVTSNGWSGRFDELIDARGQQAASIERFPFPTLRLQLCAKAQEQGVKWQTGFDLSSALTLSEQDIGWQRIHLCALPFLLHKRPFVQGLVECHEMAQDVAQAIYKHTASRVIDNRGTTDLMAILDHPSVTLADGSILHLDAKKR